MGKTKGYAGEWKTMARDWNMLKGRHFLKLLDYTPEEIEYLVQMAADLKERKKNGIRVDYLTGKNIVLIIIFVLMLLIVTTKSCKSVKIQNKN